MPTVISTPVYREAATSGAAAGLIASVIQVLVGLLLDKLLLPPRQHNNIAPRLIKRLFQKQGRPPHPVRDWSFGTLFHLAYGMSWGCVFGLVRRWLPIPSPLLGGALVLLIYGLAFSRIGVGTRTQTERHPQQRGWGKQLSLVAVAATFGITVAAAYDRLNEGL
jgi:hypothetical protein